jgi:hypothetical protein
MLVTHRRRGLLTFCMAGMQIAWFTPFVLLFVPATLSRLPLPAFCGLFVVLLFWLLLLDGLNRLRIPSPYYELSVTGLLAISVLLSARLVLYPGRPALDLSWAGNLTGTLFNLSPGASQLIVIILANVFLWQRAASFTRNETGFFGVGLSFRLGLLLLLVGFALLYALERTDATPLLWIYFGFGLTAVALARIEDKAAGAQSVGNPLPVSRLGQLLLAVGITVALAAALAYFYNGRAIVVLGTWLGPIWRVLGFALEILFAIIWRLLMPVFAGLEWLLRRLAASGALQGLAELADALSRQQQLLQAQPSTKGFHLPSWVWTTVRYGAVALALTLLIGFVVLYLERVIGKRDHQEAEDASGEPVSLGRAVVDAALGRLRDLGHLARRYGVSRQLLAAISVQNIYANVVRLARRRGYPRRPAQPPDDYLVVLRLAFRGQDEALDRITNAYMRVHYGDRSVTFDELNALRADYRRIRSAARNKREA